jgi:hypothetical protein
MSHNFEEAMISCQDPRLNQIHNQLIVQRNMVGKTDTIFFGNPILDLAKSPCLQVEEFILGKFYIAIVAHKVKTVRLYNHFNCGAYGLQGYRFHNLQAEGKVLVFHLFKAAQIIRKHFGFGFAMPLYLFEQDTAGIWQDRLINKNFAS